MSEHPSELEFDLALLGSPAEAFTTHLAGCPGCQGRLERLQKEQQAFRDGDEPRRAARIVAGRRQRRWLWAPPLLAAAAALVLLLRPVPAVREKGGPRLSLFVKGAGGIQRWQGAPLKEGDAVQLEVDPAGQPFTTVFSVGAGCVVTREHQQALDGVALIPASWTLRGAQGGERLYVTFSQRPVEAAELAQALRQNDACGAGVPAIDNAGFAARGVVLRP